MIRPTGYVVAGSFLGSQNLRRRQECLSKGEMLVITTAALKILVVAVLYVYYLRVSVKHWFMIIEY